MDIQILTVPYESGQRARRMGAGPAAIADKAVPALRTEGFTVACEAIEDDAGFALEVGTTFKLHRRVALKVRETLKAGHFPLTLTGNCGTSAVGTMAALSDGLPTGIVWFDAHGDFNTPESTASGFLDGMALSIVTGHCWKTLAASVPNFAPVPENRVIHAGGRDLDSTEVGLMENSSMCIVKPERIKHVGIVKALIPGLDYINMEAQQVYLHVDLDSLDPAEGHANQYATPGGLSLADMLTAIGVIAERLPIVAAGITSYDPAVDSDGKALRAAVEIAKKIAAVGKAAG